MKEIELLGARMHPLTMTETVELIDRRIAGGEFTQHVVVNAAKIVNMREDPALRASVDECDIINVDGMGVVWAGRILGQDIPERVAGVDLFEALVALSARRGYPIFLLGATEEVVAKVAEVLRTRHPDLDIAGFHHGYFWDDEERMVREIAASGAKLLFVAITSPKKEVFINQWKSALGVSFVMGVGGTFDVVAGKVRRAPLWMQKSGLEWLFRVCQEPRRMWKRYATTNSRFGAMVLRALVSRKA